MSAQPPGEGPRLPERRGLSFEWHVGGGPGRSRFALSSRRAGVASLPALVVGRTVLAVIAVVAVAFLLVFSVIGLLAVLAIALVLRRKLVVALRPPLRERRLRLPFRLTRR